MNDLDVTYNPIIQPKKVINVSDINKIVGSMRERIREQVLAYCKRDKEGSELLPLDIDSTDV